MFGLHGWILKKRENATPVSGPFGCFCCSHIETDFGNIHSQTFPNFRRKETLGMRFNTSCGQKETWLKYQTEEYKKAWPKPDYMNEPREMVYVRDGGDGLEIPVGVRAKGFR